MSFCNEQKIHDRYCAAVAQRQRTRSGQSLLKACNMTQFSTLTTLSGLIRPDLAVIKAVFFRNHSTHYSQAILVWKPALISDLLCHVLCISFGALAQGLNLRREVHSPHVWPVMFPMQEWEKKHKKKSKKKSTTVHLIWCKSRKTGHTSISMCTAPLTQLC